MPISRLWSRSIGALAALAAVAAIGPIQASNAAPLRTADTTDYTTADYLQREFDLPAANVDTIEPVTYDRFQWLLGHADGKLAVLIGDPSVDGDASFKARVRDTAAAAKAANVKKVYWFNPNLSGSVTVKGVKQPNLDIRDPAGITSLAAASQTRYDQAWKALIGKHLGNGLQVVKNNEDQSTQTVTVTVDPSVVNDSGASKLYDYTGGTAPAHVENSVFFVYDKDREVGGADAKIVAWSNLTTQSDSSAAQAAVTAAINAAGAATLVEVDQFAWWKSAANAKQLVQSPNPANSSGAPVVKDSDDDDGWRINQVTYPQLVDLLEHGADDKTAAILLGGTWCPNTRAVLPNLNKHAQENDVTVYNFDTVLDGAQVGGSATSAANPLQSRNTQHTGSGGSRVDRANPSFLYGALFDGYIPNAKTQYTSSNVVTYFPGGNGALPESTTRRLQVPFLFGYQDGEATRQWIIDNPNGTNTEYMTQWWLANPRPNELGITPAQLPDGAPIWNTINQQLQSATWRTDPAELAANTATEADNDQFLVAEDTATVTYNAAGNGGAGSVSVSNGGSVAIGPANLSAALAALDTPTLSDVLVKAGTSVPATSAGARSALIVAERRILAAPGELAIAEAAEPRNEELIDSLRAQIAHLPTASVHLRTVAGAWGVAQTRKGTVNTRWGTATTPGSILGGLAAVNALDVFFGGLPGGVLSRRTVTADSVVAGTAPRVTVAIENDHGRTPTGDVSLAVTRGGSTVATVSAAVVDGTASLTLPALDAGSYELAASYAGDDQIAAFTESGQLTVTAAPVVPVEPIPTTPVTPVVPVAPVVPVTPTPVTPTPKLLRVSRITGAVVTAPTSRKGGRYRVTIRVPKGASAASGRVAVQLRKGKVTKTVRGRLARGTVTVRLPKLAKGTWRVSISWPGDRRYSKASASGGRVTVRR